MPANSRFRRVTVVVSADTHEALRVLAEASPDKSLQAYVARLLWLHTEHPVSTNIIAHYQALEAAYAAGKVDSAESTGLLAR
jgi:hypothetical protein